jgi:hypothetical protein
MGYSNGDWPAHLVPDLTLDIEQIMSTVVLPRPKDLPSQLN